MNILMLLPGEFPPDIRVENEVSSLLQEGHQVVILCQTVKGKLSEELWLKAKIQRCNLSKLEYKSAAGPLIIPFYFKAWRRFVRDFLKTGFMPDAIHVHDLPLATIGLEISHRYHIPVVLDLHENWPALQKISQHTQSFLGKLISNQIQWRNYEKRMCLAMDRIIVVVGEAKERLINMGIDPRKIFIVSNTPNSSAFFLVSDSNNLEREKFKIFYGGGISKHRGLQVVVSALPSITMSLPNLHFDIVGAGRYVETLKILADRLNVSKFITFHGQQPFQKMIQLLSESDIALIPHLKSEHTDSTIPHKIFQYVFAGIPVLSSNCLPLERILIETGAGEIYNSTCPKDFQKKFDLMYNTLCNDKDFYKNQKAQSLIRNKYNWSVDAEILNRMYSELNK